VSDSLSVRVVETHYVHCLRLDFSSVFPGVGDQLPQGSPSPQSPN
jgi:hypothetical protein